MAMHDSGFALQGTNSPQPHLFGSKQGGPWQTRHDGLSTPDPKHPDSSRFNLPDTGRTVSDVDDLRGSAGWGEEGLFSPSLTARAITPSVPQHTKPASKSNKSRNGARSSTPAASQSSHKSQARRYKSNHKEGFVDDLLFGPKPQEPGFQAPWENPSDSKPKLYSLDCTDYKARADHAQSSHKSSASSSKTPSINSSMQRQGASRATPRPSSQMSRPSSARRPQSAMSAQSRHKASYVDETLFGDGPHEPGWKAPWDDGKTVKPLVFGAADVKVCIQHDVDVCREKKRRDLRMGGAGMKKTPSNPNAKPIWK